ncbi:MAG: hypothetical protein EBU52_12920 [Cytophagia bacterium]|nr:hypothetical protein [Cytophagia bacterium]
MVDPQPSVYWLGLRIDEPVTTLTDLLVSAVCFYAWYKLGKLAAGSKSLLYFRYYFLLMAVATLLGGLVGHAFLYALSFSWKLPGWIVSMFSVALIERSAIDYAKTYVPEKVGKFFLRLNVIELLVIMSITLYTLNFKWVEFHSGYGLLAIVFPFHAYVYYKTKDKGSRTIIFAVAIASIAALIFMNKIALHTWFNHLDISHTLMAIAAYIFYKGALKLYSTKH